MNEALVRAVEDLLCDFVLSLATHVREKLTQLTTFTASAVVSGTFSPHRFTRLDAKLTNQRAVMTTFSQPNAAQLELVDKTVSKNSLLLINKRMSVVDIHVFYVQKGPAWPTCFRRKLQQTLTFNGEPSGLQH